MNYIIAILNVKKQINYLTSILDQAKYLQQGTQTIINLPSKESINILENELTHLEIIKESIDRSLEDLTELEKQFVEYRYFKNWSIEKSAQKIGYSDKALFSIRNQIMDKLVISLGTIIYI